MKFGTLQQILNTMTTTWSELKFLKFKMADGCYLENRFFFPISAKFCARKHNGMLSKTTWQKLQISKIQDGGWPPFWKSL